MFVWLWMVVLVYSLLREMSRTIICLHFLTICNTCCWNIKKTNMMSTCFFSLWAWAGAGEKLYNALTCYYHKQGQGPSIAGNDTARLVRCRAIGSYITVAALRPPTRSRTATWSTTCPTRRGAAFGLLVGRVLDAIRAPEPVDPCCSTTCDMTAFGARRTRLWCYAIAGSTDTGPTCSRWCVPDWAGATSSLFGPPIEYCAAPSTCGLTLPQTLALALPWIAAVELCVGRARSLWNWLLRCCLAKSAESLRGNDHRGQEHEHWGLDGHG